MQERKHRFNVNAINTKHEITYDVFPDSSKNVCFSVRISGKTLADGLFIEWIICRLLFQS